MKSTKTTYTDQPEFVIVTGLSGAGMSSVLKSLEDMNFEVFDNFPVSLVKALAQDTTGPDRHIAVGVDTRTRGFSVEAVIDTAESLDAKLVFLTCDDAVLQKRFTETRRRHPLAKDRPVADGIKAERRMLWDIQQRADHIIDTTEMSIHDLRRILEGHFNRRDKKIVISLKSFGFKKGVPRDADIVMDVRFLQNPHWIPKLKDKSGKDADVAAYIGEDKEYAPFMTRFKAMLEPLLPRYADEGKNYLTIAIGCTGGMHRSVYIVESLAAWLNDMGFTTHVEHRDLEK